MEEPMLGSLNIAQEEPLLQGRKASTRKPTKVGAMNELMAKIDALLINQGIDPESIEVSSETE